MVVERGDATDDVDVDRDQLSLMLVPYEAVDSAVVKVAVLLPGVRPTDSLPPEA
jgi:hypothetical protein